MTRSGTCRCDKGATLGLLSHRARLQAVPFTRFCCVGQVVHLSLPLHLRTSVPDFVRHVATAARLQPRVFRFRVRDQVIPAPQVAPDNTFPAPNNAPSVKPHPCHKGCSGALQMGADPQQCQCSRNRTGCCLCAGPEAVAICRAARQGSPPPSPSSGTSLPPRSRDPPPLGAGHDTSYVTAKGDVASRNAAYVAARRPAERDSPPGSEDSTSTPTAPATPKAAAVPRATQTDYSGGRSVPYPEAYEPDQHPAYDNEPDPFLQQQQQQQRGGSQWLQPQPNTPAADLMSGDNSAAGDDFTTFRWQDGQVPPPLRLPASCESFWTRMSQSLLQTPRSSAAQCNRVLCFWGGFRLGIRYCPVVLDAQGACVLAGAVESDAAADGTSQWRRTADAGRPSRPRIRPLCPLCQPGPAAAAISPAERCGRAGGAGGAAGVATPSVHNGRPPTFADPLMAG